MQSYFSKQKQHDIDIDLVLDVAGGHGALAALLLILTSANRAVVIDPAASSDDGIKKCIRNVWASFLKDKVLDYRRECLRTALPSEL